MSMGPDIPPPRPVLEPLHQLWQRAFLPEDELAIARGRDIVLPPLQSLPSRLSFWQLPPLPVQQHLTSLPFSRCSTKAGSGSSFIKISHRYSAVDSKMVFQAWSVTKKAWRALELPWQPPTQKGKEDKQAKLAAWGRGGGVRFWSLEPDRDVQCIQNSLEAQASGCLWNQVREESGKGPGSCSCSHPRLPRDVRVRTDSWSSSYHRPRPQPHVPLM